MEEAGGRPTRVIGSLEEAHALFGPLLSRARNERLHVAHLASDFRMVGLHSRFAAPGEPVDFSMRKIIADALSLGTRSLVLAHNHPSGDALPSATDLETTRSLVYVARPLGITVRDHLIYGGERFTSLRREGLL